MKLFEQFAYGELDERGSAIARGMFPQRPRWAAGSISEHDAQFLSGLVLAIKPRKLVEVGVASGWGSVILLKAMEQTGAAGFDYFGVDLTDRFFCDPSYATGQAVEEVLPAASKHYRLITGVSVAEASRKIGDRVDFAFIDAHHMHPWATLDLLALLPFLLPGTWVALHDLNLCRKQDQQHQNRGPKYLFEGWDGDKAHSIQVPTMAGAIRIADRPADNLDLLLDILHTPWELPIDRRFTDPMLNLVSEFYGQEWGGKFRRAIEVGNHFVSKMHSRDIETLNSEITRLRAAQRRRRPGFFKRLTKRLQR